MSTTRRCSTEPTVRAAMRKPSATMRSWRVSRASASGPASVRLDATIWRYADLGYFRGGGFSSDFLTEGGMPVTMMRLNLVNGVGPVLQIAEGVTAALPEHVHDKLDKRTNETWPTT